MLLTDMVPPERRLLTVRLDVEMLLTVRILSAPEMVTFSEEVIPAAERVPVEVKLRPCAVPETTRSVPVTVDDEEMVPVTFTAADEVIPAAESVPAMSAGPPTTRLAVASTLETEMVPPDNLLLTVKLDVATLVDDIVPLETILP